RRKERGGGSWYLLRGSQSFQHSGSWTGAGLAKPPKHLWRQPRTHIRIKQRFNSDTERYLCRNRTLEKLRPGLKKPRMSWPSSLKR
uniref:Uncharacterized protein n=1 Tax=Amphilophus citrinellus TaxID=61819 RepID=A0A3Q0RU63_AMPCI